MSLVHKEVGVLVEELHSLKIKDVIEKPISLEDLTTPSNHHHHRNNAHMTNQISDTKTGNWTLNKDNDSLSKNDNDNYQKNNDNTTTSTTSINNRNLNIRQTSNNIPRPNQKDNTGISTRPSSIILDQDERKSINPSSGASFYEIPLDTPSAFRNYNETIINDDPNVRCKGRFRFILCFLAIYSFSICLASRMALNLAINEMAISEHDLVVQDPIRKHDVLHSHGLLPIEEHIEHMKDPRLLINNGDVDSSQHDAHYELARKAHYEHMDMSHLDIIHHDTSSDTTTDIITTTMANEAKDEEHTHDQERWSPKRKQILLGAFYLGYFPVMLISGYVTEKHGAKAALLSASLGSGLISLLTPIVALRLPFGLVIVLRMLLGAFQAPVVPALYAFCNRWLSPTEMGIFASFIKVAMGVGVLLGYLIPGLLMQLGFQWDSYFYTHGAICLLWAIAWCVLATSSPQDNKRVSPDELRWIMRKKPTDLMVIENGNKQRESADDNVDMSQQQQADRSVIRLMLKHPSVWALAITKLTHNFGIDFVLIEFSSFMSEAHKKTLAPVIVIACIGSVTLVTLVSLIGWSAKVVLRRKLFGFNRTIWRKIFQSVANFGMAILFFIMATTWIENLEEIGLIVVFMNFFWMFGAGGEAMAANDISIRYPATIYGFAHSISALSGMLVPGIAALVLADSPSSQDSWSIYFACMGSICAFGGFVFIFLFESKLFLPSEIQLELLPLDGSSSTRDRDNGIDQRGRNEIINKRQEQMQKQQCSNGSRPKEESLNSNQTKL